MPKILQPVTWSFQNTQALSWIHYVIYTSHLVSVKLRTWRMNTHVRVHSSRACMILNYISEKAIGDGTNKNRFLHLPQVPSKDIHIDKNQRTKYFAAREITYLPT